MRRTARQLTVPPPNALVSVCIQSFLAGPSGPLGARKQIMAPLWMVTIMSFAIFFAPPEDISGKGELLIGCFTAVIAFLFVINDKLPKTPYQHKLDKLTTQTLILIVLATVQVVAAYFLYDPCQCDHPEYHASVTCKAVVNSTADQFCVARTMGLAWAAIQFVVFLVVNFRLFLFDTIKYARRAKGGERPPYLTEKKTFIPHSKVRTRQRSTTFDALLGGA